MALSFFPEGTGPQRGAVKATLAEAGRLMIQGTTAKAAEGLVDQAAAADGPSVAAGAADALVEGAGMLVTDGVAEAERAAVASTLQLAGLLLGRAVLRDWASVWSKAQGGDDGAAVKAFIEQFVTQFARLLARREAQGCASHLADVWAMVVKLRVGTAVNDGDAEAADRMMGELHDALLELAVGASGGGSASVEVAAVSRLVVLRAVEEFGLFNRRSQRRGLPLSTHDDIRVRFHTVVLPELWARCVPVFVEFAAAAWDAPEEGAGALGGVSSPQYWMLFRVLHAMLNWRFIRPVSSTGTELTAVQTDGVPGMLPVVNGAAWKAGLEAASGDVTVISAAARMIVEGALRGRSVGQGVAIGPFVVATRHAADEVASTAAEALLQLCSLFGADEQGWTGEERGGYAMALAGQCFYVAAQVAGTAPGNSDHGTALRIACSCVERIISSIGAPEALFLGPDLNGFHQQLASLTHAVVDASAAFIDNYSDDASEEEQLVAEALERLLRAWTMLVNAAFGDATVRCRLDNLGATDVLADCTSAVFEKYVSAKVTQQLSGASRGLSAAAAAARDDEGGAADHGSEFVEAHLQSIGVLARERPDRTAAFLSSAMAPVVTALNEATPARFGGSGPDGAQPSPPLCEALWYLMRIAGHLIADDDASERPCIPSGLCAHAVRAEGRLGDEDGDPVERAKQLEQADPFFSLMAAMFQFAAMVEASVRATLDAGGQALVPPSVLEAIVFYLHRFAATYLVPDEDMQADFTQAFHYVFEGGVTAAEVTLSFVATTLAAYPFEPTCVAECISAVKAMADKAALATWLLARPEVHVFLSVGIGDGHFQLPAASRGALIGLLASIAGQASNAADPDQGYVMDENCVATPTLATLHVFRHQCEQHQASLVDVLQVPVERARATGQCDFAAATAVAETLRGALRHFQNPSVVAEAVEALLPAMGGLCDLVGAGSPFGHHLPLNTAVLDMLETAVDSCSTFLPTPLMDRLIELMQGVAGAAVGRMREAFERARASGSSVGGQGNAAMRSAEEDERCELMVKTTALLLTCATWGAFDLSMDTDPEAEAARLQRVSTFCVRGLIEVLGIVWGSPEVLSIPTVGSPLYRLLREVADTHTEALLSLPSDQEAEAILWFVREAITVADADLNLSAYGIVAALARHAKRSHEAGAASGLESRLSEFADHLWAAFATCAVDVNAVSSFAWTIMALSGAMGAEGIYNAWAQAFRTRQTAVPPESPAGRHVDSIICSAMQGTDFDSKRARGASAFAGELATALAALRGASVTL